jgi:HlyD family secretion protein
MEIGMDKKIKKKKWPPKKIASYAAIVIFVSIVLYALVFGDRSSKLNVEVEKITISTVYSGEFQEYIPVIGNVMPIETRYLDAEEGGRVEIRYIESGTPVKEGDKILKLANTNLLLDIMWRESEVYDAENRLRTTRLQIEQNSLSLRSQLIDLEYNIQLQKRAYQRAEKLLKAQLISQEEFENTRDQYFFSEKKRDIIIETQKKDSLFRQTQINQLEISLNRMKSNLEIVKQKQDNLVIRAPINGHLTSLNAEIGEIITPGERLGQIDVMDAFKVRAAIDEHYIARIEKGRYGTFDFAGTTNRLIVEQIYLEVREGRFEVDLNFVDVQPSGIRRGMTVHIKLELGDLEEAILLPRGGFYQTTGGQWVYILDKSGSFAVKRPIKLGRYNPKVFTVLEGLEPGEQVITSSYDNFGDIDKLILKE